MNRRRTVQKTDENNLLQWCEMASQAINVQKSSPDKRNHLLIHILHSCKPKSSQSYRIVKALDECLALPLLSTLCRCKLQGIPNLAEWSKAWDECLMLPNADVPRMARKDPEVIERALLLGRFKTWLHHFVLISIVL